MTLSIARTIWAVLIFVVAANIIQWFLASFALLSQWPRFSRTWMSRFLGVCVCLCECHWKEILADGGPLMRLYCIKNCKHANHRTNVTYKFISLDRKAISVECRRISTQTYKHQYTTPIQAVGTHFLEYTRTRTRTHSFVHWTMTFLFRYVFIITHLLCMFMNITDWIGTQMAKTCG